MNKKTIRIAGWALGLSMAVAGIGLAVGTPLNYFFGVSASEERSITINASNMGVSSWGSGYESGLLRSAEIGGINIHGHYLMKNSKNSPSSGAAANTYIQSQKSNANIYNASGSPLGARIKSITIVQSAAAPWSLYVGTSELFSDSNVSTGQTPSTGTLLASPASGTTMTWNNTPVDGKNDLSDSDYTYFCLVLGGTNTYVSSITLTYEVSDEPEESKTLDAVSSVSATVTAQEGANEWTVTNLVVRGTLSGETNQDVTDYVDWAISEAVPDTTSDSFPVTFTISKKDGVDGSFVSKVFEGINATVSERPFKDMVKVTETSAVKPNVLYALSNDGLNFAGNSVVEASKSMVTTTSEGSHGLFRLEPSGTNGKYYLSFATGNSFPYTANTYINNASGTDLTNGGDQSLWQLAQGTNCVYLTNSSNSGRHLGLNGSNVKAYAASNIGTNLPVYLYEAPTDKLASIALQNANSSFDVGDEYSFGGTVDATYSSSGTTGHTGLSSGLSFKFKAKGAGSYGEMPATFTKEHDEGSVQVTYTDAWGGTASTAYEISVDYASVTGLTLNSGNTLNLAKDGGYQFIATVAPTNANPAVIWSAETDDFDANESEYELSDAGYLAMNADHSGTIVVTATSVSDGSISASCTVNVTSDPVLILDVKSLTGKFTGDADAVLTASATNFGTGLTFTWTSSDTDVATVTQDPNNLNKASVHYVGGGTATISVRAQGSDGDLTETCSVSVTASAVTAITLNKTSGTLYAGRATDTIEVTSYTKVGNAEEGVTWETSDPEVATVSNGVVTPVGAGSATITARSTFTNATTATYTATVLADAVTALSWSGRPKVNDSDYSGYANIYAGETTLGDLAATGANPYGSFTATWLSSTPDTPSFGTGDHQVHLGLYDTATPTVEGAALSESYVFQKADSGKYLVAFYEGKASSANKALKVINWRSVTAETSGDVTLNWTSNTLYDETGSLKDYVEMAVSNAGKNYESDPSAMRIGSNKSAGSITVTATGGAKIKSISADVAYYSTKSSSVVTIANQEFDSLENSSNFATKTVSNLDATSVTLEVEGYDHQVLVKNIVVTLGVTAEVGKTEDALALEAFIDSYMHMSDVSTENHSDTNACRSEGDGAQSYYALAKAAYNDNEVLSVEARALFISNSAYAAERARLVAWAAANGDQFDNDNLLIAKAASGLSFFNGTSDNDANINLVVPVALAGLAAAGGFFLISRKRREEE